jgi:DNA polymerase (family X)
VDARSVAHALRQIGDLLTLRGANRFQARAYRTAARAVIDLGSAQVSGSLRHVPGIGPATDAVITEIVETGTSSLLERLRAETPVGLLDVMRIPGLRAPQVRRLHTELGIDSLDSLEAAALDGRLARLPRIGPHTVARMLRGIAAVRRNRDLKRGSAAAIEAHHLLALVTAHPGVERAAIAGSVRRRAEIVRDIDIVVATREDVAASFSATRQPIDGGTRLVFADGLTLDLFTAPPERFAVTLWRATGSAEHVAQVHPSDRPFTSEHDLYASVGLPYIEPELREGLGEVEAARSGALPRLVTTDDVRGVWHTHSTYSDGRATLADLAEGARARGWEFIGISDHSQAAFYANGLTPDAVLAQHEEIDRLNASFADGFRVYKGIEADILPDGSIDYDAELNDRFDFVIASVHSRFRMTRDAMTARVLRALDDPHVTILGHPTGRLLLHREPYALDLDAVLEKAADRGVAVEINADPYRLDLGWRDALTARRLGAMLVIGPDAHSVAALDNVELGVAVARKAWVERSQLKNA